ncbi:Maf family protein [Arenicellales bacterium nBUS_48]|jgi:MAF protein|nr:septum formation inhibitor Maf [Pseudomonadota bacterium]
MLNQKVILASTSPYRKELLTRLGVPFDVVAPNVPEKPLPQEKPADLALRLAITKAKAGAALFSEGLVIGSDQVAEVNGVIMGKPADRQAAIDQLTLASGNRMTLYTGLALVNVTADSVQSAVEPYYVRYRELSLSQINRYVDTEEPYGCCGSLKSEGLGITFLSELSGKDPTALIGLPLIRLTDMLSKEGIEFPVSDIS